MDIQMPEMDGFQTTRSIRQYELEQNLKRIPIIALTANGSHVDKDKYLSAGMDDYLIKPVNSQLLKDTIQKWLLI
jgi:CheY-like chemotaxis protein